MSDVNTNTYDAALVYKVKLRRPVTTGRIRLLPGNEQEIRGGLLNRIVAEQGAEVIDRAEPISVGEENNG